MFLNSSSFLKLGAVCTAALPKKLHDFIGLRLAKIKANGNVRREIQPGVFLELNLSDWLQRLYYVGLVEDSIFKRLKTLVPVGGTFVDVGAYIGLFTCVMANHVGPEGSVIAFEPMSECFDQLQHNVRLNQFQNVRAQRLAVSNRMGLMDLYLHEGHSGGASGVAQVWNPGDWKAFSRISSVSLDSVLHGDSLHLIKIDVQGHELEVLEGTQRIIEFHHPIILCEVSAQNQDSVFQFIRSFGYDIFTESSKGGLDLYASTKNGMDRDFFFVPGSKAVSAVTEKLMTH